jgi:hypothetical protein
MRGPRKIIEKEQEQVFITCDRPSELYAFEEVVVFSYPRP